MNIHKNARLTVAGRGVVVKRVLGGEHPLAVAAAMGVSERTIWKWVGRYRCEGEEGLKDRSSRPHQFPQRLRRSTRRRIGEYRRKRRWSSTRIAFELALPVSTVGKELRRQGLSRLPSLAPPQPVVRYERKRPGELLHLDTKKLGRIRRIGHRIHGDRSRRSPGAGWEFLYVAIDDATRLGYCEVLRDEQGHTAAGFVRRAVRWFERLEIRIERVMTDNGSCFLSKAFAAALQEVRARHIRTRPYTPRTNGKAERFIQTAKREWAYDRPYRNSTARNAQLRPWLRYYNESRRHMGIGGTTPQQRLRSLAEQRP